MIQTIILALFIIVGILIVANFRKGNTISADVFWMTYACLVLYAIKDVIEVLA